MTDHFERLGLPRRFSLNLAELEAAYLRASRQAHPDFSAAVGDSEKLEAEMKSAQLNEAYTTLKDTTRRAEYWLSLHGGSSAQEEKNLDQAFLMAMMELQEQIEEAEQDRLKLDVIQQQVDDLKIQKLSIVETLFTEPLTTASMRAARQHLNAVKTLSSLQRRLEAVDD